LVLDLTTWKGCKPELTNRATLFMRQTGQLIRQAKPLPWLASSPILQLFCF